MIHNTLFLAIMMMICSCASTQSTTDNQKLMAEQAQPVQELPYRQIPETPEEFTAEKLAARMIDGLGYRYYWSTELLKPEDLQYKITEEARTMEETMGHVHGLSKTILNGVLIKPNVRSANQKEMSWVELRAATLNNLKQASDILRNAGSGDIENYKIIFQRGDKSSEFPFWNMINGPISDALWHTGQIVSFRRAAGNPIPPGVNVLTGKTFE